MNQQETSQKEVYKERYKALIDHLGGPTETARKLNVAQSTASGWQLGSHFMSVKHARRAEAETNKKYLAKDLCPDLSDDLNLTAA